MNSNFKEICPEVFVYENFFSNEEIKDIMEKIISSKEEENNYEIKVTFLEKYKERILGLFENLNMEHMSIIAVRRKGMGMQPHVDITNVENRIRKCLVDDSFDGPTEAQGFAAWSVLLYFNDDYDGGEICYPEYNIEYKPKAGSLVIHRPAVVHAVKKMKGGIRYSHQNSLGEVYRLDKEKYDAERERSKLDLEPNGQIYYYSIDDPYLENERLLKFKESYVERFMYNINEEN
jgi:hypothetical protein